MKLSTFIMALAVTSLQEDSYVELKGQAPPTRQEAVGVEVEEFVASDSASSVTSITNTPITSITNSPMTNEKKKKKV